MGYKSEQDGAEVARLREIQQEMLTLLDKAVGIVTEHAPVMVAARAVSYWIPEVRIALVKEHNYLASCMCCMDDTIEEMTKSAGDNDEDGYDNTDDSED